MTHLTLVPWQDTGCPHRAAALTYVLTHLSGCGGFALAELPTGELWSKGGAVTAGLADIDATVLVISDADVLVDPASLAAAVSAVASGRRRWAIPHRQVWRLTPEFTAAVLAGEPLDVRARYERRYQGVEGGGVVVIATDAYMAAPFDPAFVGWGGEDVSAGVMWRCLYGAPWRAETPLRHLWHPPQPKISAAVGSRASKLIELEYRAASSDPEAMRALIAARRSRMSAVTDTATART